MQESPVGELLGLLIKAPFIIARDFLRLAAWGVRFASWIIRRRGLPPYQRNQTRAMWGAFVLTAAIYAAAVIPDFTLWSTGGEVLAGVMVLAVIYLGIGVYGSAGAPFDAVSLVWWGLLALVPAALLIERVYYGDPVADEVIEGLYIATLTAALVRIALALRRLPKAKLPDPETVPGMPMAGAASVDAAREAMMRRRARVRPTFRT